MSKILLVANSDWMLYNFRLPMAEAFRAQGHDVVLICPLGRYETELRASGFRCVNWRLSRGGLNPFGELLAAIRLFGIYRREAPDIVQHFTIKPNLYGSLVLRAARFVRAIRRDVICVNTFTGLGFVFSTHRAASLLRFFVQPLLRFALATPRTMVVFQNKQDLGLFLRAGLVTPERGQLIVSSGVDTSRFHPNGAANPAHANAPQTVVMASRVLWDKGVGVYAEASRVLRRRGSNTRFLLVGEPDPASPGSIPIEKLEEWQKEGLIEWLGHRADMPEILRHADIAVLPSNYNEGVPRVLLEAAATGLPIVATDIEGCRVIVRPGQNGLLVPPRNPTALSNAIERLTQDPNLRREMGRESFRIATTEFDERMIVAQWLAYYERLHEGAKGEKQP